MRTLPRLLLGLGLTALLGTLPSCRQSQDDLSSTSVLRSSAKQTDLDKYIEQEITKPYNIELYYRYREFEIDRSWVTSPAPEGNSLQFANVLKYLFLEPYTEVMGIDFVRRFSPQALVLNGTLGYNPPPSKTNTRAFTVNGVKIVFMNINSFNFPTQRSYFEQVDSLGRLLESNPGLQSQYDNLRSWVESENQYYLDLLRTSYLRTLFHESAHTFHQRVEPSRDFDKISSLDYRQADWISGWTNEGKNSLHYGFITNYASQEPHEDFAELFGNYIILTPAEWEARLTTADVTPDGRTASGREIIERKMQLLRSYMQEQWDLNIDTLRAHVQTRFPNFSRQDFSQMSTSSDQR